MRRGFDNGNPYLCESHRAWITRGRRSCRRSSSLSKMNSSRVVPADSGEDTVYHVGTLRYTRHGLYVLFFWLMWNDFSITLLEQVGGLVGFLYKDLGASNFEMASFGSISGLISMWINPWFSTWSDRTRTKYGRRRPFVFLATPFFALFLMLIPYMPAFYHRLARYPMAAEILQHLPIKGEIFFIFICSFVSGVFNAMVLAIFSYLYWDVVPANVLGALTPSPRSSRSWLDSYGISFFLALANIT